MMNFADFGVGVWRLLPGGCDRQRRVFGDLHAGSQLPAAVFQRPKPECCTSHGLAIGNDQRILRDVRLSQAWEAPLRDRG